MDSILTTLDILEPENWINFKIYQDPLEISSITEWKNQLDWYHRLLKDLVKPEVEKTTKVRVIFFSTYFEIPNTDKESYEKQIELPENTKFNYIRLRLSVAREDKEGVKDAFTRKFDNASSIVWNYETMTTYHVREDLGDRFGSNIDNQTLMFIRYWDSTCRYILSILTLPRNWTQDIDVWGIPHLVNNSLGAWLRPERDPVLCDKCKTHMYMATWYVLDRMVTPSLTSVPYCLFVCPNCSSAILKPHSI